MGGPGNEVISLSRMFRLTGTPKTSVIRARARPASARPTETNVDRSRSVRRPNRRVSPGTCSANVLRGQERSGRRNRRTRNDTTTNLPTAGGSRGNLRTSHVFDLTSTRIQGRPPRWQWSGPRPGRPCRSPRSTPRSRPPPRRTTAHPAAAVLRSRRSTVDHTAFRAGDFRVTSTATTRRSTVTSRTRPPEVDQSVGADTTCRSERGTQGLPEGDVAEFWHQQGPCGGSLGFLCGPRRPVPFVSPTA